MIEFLKRLLELLEKCPSKRTKASRITSLKDECLDCAKSYNKHSKGMPPVPTTTTPAQSS